MSERVCNAKEEEVCRSVPVPKCRTVEVSLMLTGDGWALTFVIAFYSRHRDVPWCGTSSATGSPSAASITRRRVFRFFFPTLALNSFYGLQECEEHFEKVCHTEHERVCSLHSNRVCVEVPLSAPVPIAVAQPASKGSFKGLLKSLKFAKLAKLKAHKEGKGDKGLFKRSADESDGDESEEQVAKRRSLEDLRDQVDEEIEALEKETQRVGMLLFLVLLV